MLEKFQKRLEELKEQQNLMPTKIEMVEGYFEMEDTNKFLRFHAYTEEQKQRADKFDEQLQKVFKKLCVPKLQIKNT